MGNADRLNLVFTYHIHHERAHGKARFVYTGQTDCCGTCDGNRPQLSVGTLYAIAQALHVSTDYLLGLSDDPHGNLGNELTPEQQKLLNAYILGDGPTLLEMIAERLRQNS